MTESRLLKKDLFGEIRLVVNDAEARIVRDTAAASAWIRWFARCLLRREARVLAALSDIHGVPHIVHFDANRLERRFLPGEPMHVAKPRDPAWFNAAARLLRRLHRAGVVHNDLAKEPNILVCADGSPAFIDFQLAWFAPRRGRLFRLLGYDDIRHLLKHKRTYCPDRLTRRERNILATPSVPSRVWRKTVKPVYLFITRRLLNWSDREGTGDRGEAR